MARKKRRNRQIVIVGSTIIGSNISGDNSSNVEQSICGVDANVIGRLLALLEEKDKQIDRLVKLLEQYKNIGGQEDGE